LVYFIVKFPPPPVISKFSVPPEILIQVSSGSKVVVEFPKPTVIDVDAEVTSEFP